MIRTVQFFNTFNEIVFFIKESQVRPVPTNLQVGDSCGQCYCPPHYTMGDCASGLECKHDKRIADAPGKCVKQIHINASLEGITYQKTIYR